MTSEPTIELWRTEVSGAAATWYVRDRVIYVVSLKASRCDDEQQLREPLSLGIAYDTTAMPSGLWARIRYEHDYGEAKPFVLRAVSEQQ